MNFAVGWWIVASITFSVGIAALVYAVVAARKLPNDDGEGDCE